MTSLARSTQSSTHIPDAPTVAPKSFLTGSMRPFRDDPLRFLCRVARDYGDTARFRMGPVWIHAIRHPDDVQRVLVTNNRNYDKRTHGYDGLRQFLGNGLLTSEGDFWRRQRRIAQPGFHRERIAGFAETMTSMTVEMLTRWSDAANRGDAVDMEREMMALTLRIAGMTLLNTDPERSADDVGAAVTVMNHAATRAMMNPRALPLSWPTPGNLKARKAGRRLDGIVTGIIAERRRTGEDPGDLLSMLMNTTDADTGERMSDAQLRDEVMTMFLAGHETTANALAWAFYALSTHPAAAREVSRELGEVLGGRVPTSADVPKLRYLRAVIDESMRLYPPAWGVGRRAIDDDVLGGYRIPAGSWLVLSPYSTHRHPDFWPNPEAFDPQRFLNPDPDRPKYAYFPFSGGPRFCIGQQFALMELVLIMATVLQRYRPWLVAGHPVVTEALITLRPKFGLPMHLAVAGDA